MSGTRVPPTPPVTPATPEAEDAVLERRLARALARLLLAQEADRARLEQARRYGR